MLFKTKSKPLSLNFSGIDNIRFENMLSLISSFYRLLKSFIKQKNVGYKRKKSKTLLPEELDRFMNDAPDGPYCFIK